jgi:uncharacterized protein (TIGR00645 family)
MVSPATFLSQKLSYSKGESMKSILEKSRYLAWIGVIALLVAAVAAFAWGSIKTVNAVWLVVESLGDDSDIIVEFIEVIDSFLVATAILIFTVSLYELFIGDLDVPEWMPAHNLYELKSKLSSMIVLVMGAKFLQKLLEVKDTNDLLRVAVSITLVSGALIAFGYFGKKD